MSGVGAYRALRRVYPSVAFANDVVSVVGEDELPRGWASNPAPRPSEVAGDEWLEARSVEIGPVLDLEWDARLIE